jgi:hypothetical protein
MTMSAPRWSARALECASAKALGLCQTSSAGGCTRRGRVRGPMVMSASVGRGCRGVIGGHSDDGGGDQRRARHHGAHGADGVELRAGGLQFHLLSPGSLCLGPSGADGEGRAVQRAKVPRQAGSGVDRSSGAKRGVRISARGALLSVGPPSCPECAGSGTAACRSVRAGLLFDCLSALVRDQRRASKRQDPAHACSEVPSTFGRGGLRCGDGGGVPQAARSAARTR